MTETNTTPARPRALFPALGLIEVFEIALPNVSLPELRPVGDVCSGAGATSPSAAVRVHFKRPTTKVKGKLAAATQANELEEKKRLAELRRGRPKDIAPELWPQPRLDVDGKQVWRFEEGLVDEKRQPARVPVIDPPAKTAQAVEGDLALAFLLIAETVTRVEGLQFGELASEDVKEPEVLVDMLEQAGVLKDVVDHIGGSLQPKGRQVF